MDLKKAKADNKIYEVVKEDEFVKAKSGFAGATLAVEQGEFFYPERNMEDALTKKPGIYDYETFFYYEKPTKPEDIEELSINNIIDFNGKNIKDIILSDKLLKDKEREILISSDNIDILTISDNDEPEMKGLKLAINAKKMDIDTYESRFGANFNNDKRLITKNTISMKKLKSICENLDINVKIVLEDSNDNVVNPIGKPIEIYLVNGESE